MILNQEIIKGLQVSFQDMLAPLSMDLSTLTEKIKILFEKCIVLYIENWKHWG